MSELTKGQKTEVENILFKTLIAGGLITTIVAAVIGYFSGHLVVSKKLVDINAATLRADTAANKSRIVQDDIHDLLLGFEDRMKVGGLPIAIICNRSDDARAQNMYWLENPSHNTNVIYARVIAAPGSINHKIVFNNNKEIIESTNRNENLVDCLVGENMDDIINDSRAFGALSLREASQ